MEIAKCIGVTKANKPCTNKQKYGQYCGIHKLPTDVVVESKQVITITYGDICENHVGMQKIEGNTVTRGFNLDELTMASTKCTQLGALCELYNLGNALSEEYKGQFEDAYVLIIRNGVDILLKDINKTSDDMVTEQLTLDWDKTFLSTKHKNNGNGGVVNKIARWNLCYAEQSQIPDIANGKGTVIAFKDIPCTNHIRSKLPELLGATAENMVAEGNFYYDTSKCGIGFHGDAERNLVVAARLGSSMPLYFQWYLNCEHITNVIELQLNSGDMYIMSSKSVGKDWKKRSLLTLRHAAGCVKLRTI